MSQQFKQHVMVKEIHHPKLEKTEITVMFATFAFFQIIFVTSVSLRTRQRNYQFSVKCNIRALALTSA